MKKKNKVAMNFICTESVKWKQKKGELSSISDIYFHFMKLLY